MNYFIKKLLSGILLVIGVSVVTFYILRLGPGNPAAAAFDPNSTRHDVSQVNHLYGLDKPLLAQFGEWMKNIFRGHWGYSYASHRKVAEIIRETLPNTLILTASVLFVQVVFGTWLGLVQVSKTNSLFDKSINWLTLVLYGLPVFWLALVFILIFSHKLGWLPSSQIVSFYYKDLSWLGRIMDRLRHLALPLLSMSLVSIAVMARYVKASLKEIMQQDFIVAARARGLSERRILYKHALRNVLIPVATLTGQYFPALVGSSIVIELVYSWPGMGRLIVLSTFARDYPVIIACTFVMSVFVVMGNLFADFLVACIDPRIRLEA